MLLCETDRKELTRALTDSSRVVFHDHSVVLRDILELLNRPWRVFVNWVPRECNMVVDSLVKKGLHSRVIERTVIVRPELDL